MDKAIAILERGVRGHRVGFGMLSVALIVIGAIGLVAIQNGVALGNKALFGAYALPPFGLAVLAYVLLKRYPMLEAMRTSPQDVVWWYLEDRGRNGMHLVVGLANGKLDTLPLDLATDAAPLGVELTRALPHATRGYSQELAERFKANAAQLRLS